MDGSQGGAAPFLVKTYEMIDDHLTNYVVSWSETGKSFVVWDPPEFAKDLLPKYFKHNNFNSFIRQLNTYGFRKIDPEQWEFANEEFIRGEKHLLKNIYRRKPIHSHSTPKNATHALTDPEREEFEKEIERLKRDNAFLQTDLTRHKQENQAYEQRLVEIDQRQKQLVTFLAQQLNKREFTSTIMQLSETHNNNNNNNNNNKKRKLLESRKENVSFQRINSEIIEKLDSSINFWENFLQEVNQTPVEDVYEFGVLPQHQSPVHVSSKSSRIDVNSSPDNVLDVNPSRRNQGEGSISQAVPTEANDVFWQQFFTETTTRVSDAREVQSERKETTDCRRNGSEGHQQSWWNVDSLAKQMGHISPAGKT